MFERQKHLITELHKTDLDIQFEKLTFSVGSKFSLPGILGGSKINTPSTAFEIFL